MLSGTLGHGWRRGTSGARGPDTDRQADEHRQAGRQADWQAGRLACRHRYTHRHSDSAPPPLCHIHTHTCARAHTHTHSHICSMPRGRNRQGRARGSHYPKRNSNQQCHVSMPNVFITTRSRQIVYRHYFPHRRRSIKDEKYLPPPPL